MNGVTGFLQIFRSIYEKFFSINVPGTDISFSVLLASVLLLAFAINIVRFLLGLPMGFVKDGLREEFKKDFK